MVQYDDEYIPEDIPSPRPTTRIPPNDIDAEESLLGAMLLSREAILIGAERCAAEDFYRPLHAQIFAAIVELTNKGSEVDFVTVKSMLESRGIHTLDATLLAKIQLNTPSAANAADYAGIVRDRARQRRLIEVTSRISDEAFQPANDVDALMDRAESAILEISDRDARDTISELVPLLIDEMNTLEERAQNAGAITGIETGYRSLDALLRGIQPTSLTIIGARPSVGKTAFALGILMHVGAVMQRPALFFSLEMGKNELAERILATTARIDSSRLKTGELNEMEWKRTEEALGTLQHAPIFIDDNPNLTVMEVRGRARRLKQQQGDLGVVIIDYLQLMSTRGRSENRQVEVSEMSRGLKILARELGCPVIALSQLSRAMESRSDKTPQMSDLRESGSLEQDADIVIFLHRPEMHSNEVPLDRQGIVEVILSKHRNGPIGRANVTFVQQYARFENMGEDFAPTR
ncbi:MAG: replicative DNA helicase [Actinomycetota bacterium]|jgi:replicative DNA helicase